MKRTKIEQAIACLHQAIELLDAEAIPQPGPLDLYHATPGEQLDAAMRQLAATIAAAKRAGVGRKR